MEIKLILLVGSGSFFGGIFRYMLSYWILERFPSAFPYGTLTVNLVGCFLIGLVFGLAEKVNLYPDWRIFIATGFIGGFTTFSAFSYESISLMSEGQTGNAIAYIVASVVFGLLATVLGLYVIKVL